MSLFDGLFVNLTCPNCSYGMDVELSSVRLEGTTFCPCCKLTVQLVDGDASVYGAQEEVDQGMEELKRELKKFNKTITFRI